MPVLLSSRPASAQFNIGCMIIGTYINTVLYGLVMLCVYLYFRSERSKRDPLILKVAVAVNAVMDTVSTFGLCSTCFYLTVLRWGDYDREFRTHWPPILAFLASAVSEFIVQGFMLRRYFIMSRRYLVTGLVVTLMLLSLVSNLYLGISSAAGTLPSRERPTNLTPYVIVLTSTLAADLATSTAMFWTLKKTNTHTRISHHMVSRISAIVIMTGTLTCIFVIVTMTAFLTYPMSALTSLFNCFLGRIYTVTMLFTLLYRDMINNDQWIQVDERTVNTNIDMTSDPSLSDSLPSANASVEDMTFARRNSLAPPRSAKNIEEKATV